MIILKSCPNCDSSDFKEYKTVLDGNLVLVYEIAPGIKINAAVVTRYAMCQNCHLIFQNPRLSDSELDKYYGSGYYRQTINAPEGGRDKAEADRAKVDAEIIKKYIGKVTSHLDVGFGSGLLLEEVGADAKVGVEPDLDYTAVKGVEVYPDMTHVPSKSFDLVTTIHVLEHVPYPLDFLQKMAKFVKKEGHLVVEVPSWELRGGPLGFAHLHHFEPDVLKSMCAAAGLKVIHEEFTPHLVLICKL